MRRKTYPIAVDTTTIGARIRELRRRRGMTQVELAAKMDMGQSVLSRYERGDIRVDGALVTGFARALAVSTDELLGLKKSLATDAPRDRRFLRRLQKVERLTRGDKQALLKTIDAFLLKVS